MTIFKALTLFLLLSNPIYADDVLTRITSHLSKAPVTQGSFQQEKHLKFLRKPLLSTGSFTYDQNKGVIWKTITPIPSLLLVNDEHLLTAQGEQALPPAFGRVFKTLLGGELNTLSEGFEIVGREQKTTWQLQLTPKDELLKKVIKSIMLSGDFELRQLEINELNNNLTLIKFSEITHPDRLSNEQQAEFERLSP
ncbi:outer membrane lipoprotein carrier protein LolA [Methyloglobulus sp.]|uniref:outer membrane lipoprotein carrier protein LolA n=1 Tax=Methyloglobulus sp. TaxID=2518622 RepID=UPI0032B86136